MHIAAHFCRLYLSFIGKSNKIYLLKWLQFGRLLGIYGRKEVFDLSFKEFLLDVLDRTVNASWYRSVGCSPDEASFLADMEANSRNTSRRSRQLSNEEIKTRIEESRKGYDEAMATLAECQRKLREGGPLVREGAEKARQKALRFREEARKKNR